MPNRRGATPPPTRRIRVPGVGWPHPRVPKVELLRLLARGLAYNAIARVLGVHHAQISRAVRDLRADEWATAHERALRVRQRDLAAPVVASHLEPVDVASEIAVNLARLRQVGARLDQWLASKTGLKTLRTRKTEFYVLFETVKGTARLLKAALDAQEKFDRWSGSAGAKRALLRALERADPALKQRFLEAYQAELAVARAALPGAGDALASGAEMGG